ncbi:MAG: hypothetical protein HFG27_00740 [Provencibacterium sp.]|nr:hypothetical protein [Provencibacterium sp.]
MQSITEVHAGLYRKCAARRTLWQQGSFFCVYISALRLSRQRKINRQKKPGGIFLPPGFWRRKTKTQTQRSGRQSYSVPFNPALCSLPDPEIFSFPYSTEMMK